MGLVLFFVAPAIISLFILISAVTHSFITFFIILGSIGISIMSYQVRGVFKSKAAIL